MKGLLASATLYGEFMEKYVYSESAVENKINYKQAEKGFFVYDVGSIISVWGWQLTYSLMVPFIMFVEVIFTFFHYSTMSHSFIFQSQSHSLKPSKKASKILEDTQSQTERKKLIL